MPELHVTFWSCKNIENLTVLTIIPPIFAVVTAILTRKVFLSLFAGVFVSELILFNGAIPQSIMATINLLLEQFSQPWKIKTILFVILVGSIIRLISASGGVEAFIAYVNQRHINSKRTTLFMGYVVGLIIFIESSITSLIVGAITKPLAKCYKISNAKIAYLCDSTSAPVCSLILFNGWGALLLGLISVQLVGTEVKADPLSLLMHATIFNFYSIVTLIVLFLVIYTDKDFGPMKKAELKAFEQKERCNLSTLNKSNNAGVTNMFFPIIIMIFSVPLFLYISGDGSILKGSGSSAIFYSVSTTLIFMIFYYLIRGVMDYRRYLHEFTYGAFDMLGIALILISAFALGEVSISLKTGEYLANLAVANVSKAYLPIIIFLISAVISFSTGTSWGTFSIMIPIALPLAMTLGSDLPLAIAAVISGGVFGDHCSPISDTTIISSMAARCDHIEHVRTQLPYALLSGAVSAILFLIFGIFH